MTKLSAGGIPPKRTAGPGEIVNANATWELVETDDGHGEFVLTLTGEDGQTVSLVYTDHDPDPTYMLEFEAAAGAGYDILGTCHMIGYSEAVETADEIRALGLHQARHKWGDKSGYWSSEEHANPS
jgi:hypothetical protein